MLVDDASVQLTRCSAQTEATSGRTVKQPPPPEDGVDKNGCIGDVAPTPTPQQEDAGSKAADFTIADPKVGQIADEGPKLVLKNKSSPGFTCHERGLAVVVTDVVNPLRIGRW